MTGDRLDDIITPLNTRPVRQHGACFVLCWLRQTLRAEDNPVLDVAIARANALGLPVLVYHGIDNRYPLASHRLHRFLCEASGSLERGCVERGFCRYQVAGPMLPPYSSFM